MQRNSRIELIAWFMMAGGLAFVFLLILLTREGVFFSGDAGLKYLVVRQMNGGGSFVFLHPPKASWVKEIWDQGFFPFSEPFVYDKFQEKVVGFPPAFQWISLPLYRLMGFRGLYLLPAVSVFLLWVSFWNFIRKINVTDTIRLLLLAVLIFATPLTVYGGLYWEHAIAVALSFAGIGFIAGRRISPLFAGFLFGLSVWLRPELLVFSGLGMISLLIWRKNDSIRRTSSFFIGISLPILSFFTFNYMIYGHVLGAHAFQLDATEGTMLLRPAVFTLLVHINARLVEFFPASVFLCLIIYSLLKGGKYPPPVHRLTFMITCFLLLVPFFIPNAGGKQWGPRYLLAVIPALILLYGVVAGELKSGFNRFVIAGMTVALAAGFCINIFWSYPEIRDDYGNRVAPALSWLNADEHAVVIVQNQYITQEMAGAFDRKIFFVAETEDKLKKLIEKLRRAGVGKINYMCYSGGPGLDPATLKPGFISSEVKGNYVIITSEISDGSK